jgi:hypothetical protein
MSEETSLCPSAPIRPGPRGLASADALRSARHFSNTQYQAMLLSKGTPLGNVRIIVLSGRCSPCRAFKSHTHDNEVRSQTDNHLRAYRSNQQH